MKTSGSRKGPGLMSKPHEVAVPSLLLLPYPEGKSPCAVFSDIPAFFDADYGSNLSIVVGTGWY